MLSTTSIASELGKNIIIYPFKEKLLKGIGYNLTVSPYGWSLRTKNRLTLNPEKTHFIIEAGDTALIQTNETVWSSKKIGGTFQSKVDRMSEGFSAISTTLDPGWIGNLLIAITNMTNSSIKLRIDDSFVTLIFHKIKKAPTPKAKNDPMRIDRLAALGIQLDEDFDKWRNQDFRQNVTALKKKLKEDSEFQSFKSKNTLNIILSKITPYIPAIIIFLFLLYLIYLGNLSTEQQLGGILVALIAALSLGYSLNNKTS